MLTCILQVESRRRVTDAVESSFIFFSPHCSYFVFTVSTIDLPRLSTMGFVHCADFFPKPNGVLTRKFICKACARRDSSFLRHHRRANLNRARRVRMAQAISPCLGLLSLLHCRKAFLYCSYASLTCSFHPGTSTFLLDLVPWNHLPNNRRLIYTLKWD